MDILNWLLKHWEEVIAAIGIGSSGGIAGKVISGKKQDRRISELDKKQDDKIEAIEGKLYVIESNVALVDQKIKTNTKFDNLFREQMQKEHDSLKGSINKIEDNVQRIYDHLLKSGK